MPNNPYSQDGNETHDNPYASGKNGKSNSRKLLFIAIIVLATIAIVVLAVHFSQPESQQSKYIKSATVAARKVTPNAKVADVKVAGNFAMAIVRDPTAIGQAESGNATIFKVNKDGSMTQIANGSSFSPLDLLGLGIPLATQSKLTGNSLEQVKQNLASACGYDSDSVPGYSGFDGSFSPDEWQIDAATLNGLEQALSDTISNQNTESKPGKAVICVNATQKNSNATTDTKTYISNFIIQVQFVTSDGSLTIHTLDFAVGPNYYHSYTLDGHNI